MKYTLIIISLIIIVTLSYWLHEPKETAAHSSFVGSAPQPSKPYNILDYTKPVSKP